MNLIQSFLLIYSKIVLKNTISNFFQISDFLLQEINLKNDIQHLSLQLNVHQIRTLSSPN